MEGGRPPEKMPGAVGQGLGQGTGGGDSALVGDGGTIRGGSSEEVVLELGFQGCARVLQSDQGEGGKASGQRHRRWK